MLVLDESGQAAVRPPASGSFVWGGYVVAERDLPWLANWVRRIKSFLTDGPEIKSAEVFKASSATSDAFAARLLNAKATVIIRHFLETEPTIKPLVVEVEKSAASGSLVIQASKGTAMIDRERVFDVLIAGLAGWLERANATGCLLLDRLGSRAEEDRLQDSWTLLRKSSVGTRFVRVEEILHFDESVQNEAIQLADLLVGGVSRALHREPTFASTWVPMIERAQAEGLGLVHLR